MLGTFTSAICKILTNFNNLQAEHTSVHVSLTCQVKWEDDQVDGGWQ